MSAPGWLRALALVVERPGQLDAQAAGDALRPPPALEALPRAHREPVDPAAWSRLGLALPVSRSDAVRARLASEAARELHRAASRRWAQGLLRELVRRGLVQPARRHMLATSAAAMVADRGAWDALRSWEPVVDRRGRMVAHRPGAPPSRWAVAILEALALGAMEPAELRRSTGGNGGQGERGDWRRAFRQLCTDGWVVPASQRWPTLAGVQLVVRERGEGGRLESPHTRSPVFPDCGEVGHTPDRLSFLTGTGTP